MEFAPIDENTAPELGDVKGVIVRQVQRGAPAARFLRPGDIVMSVNRKRVTTVADLEKLAGADQKQLMLHIRRGNNAFFLTVQ